MSETRGIVRLHQWWPWLAALLSGELVTICFAPANQTWACWIALTPLLAAVWFSGEGKKWRGLRDLLLGYVAGVAWFWSTFWWLRTVTLFGLILLGFYMGVYMALFAWLAGLVRPREKKTPGVQVTESPSPNDQAEASSPWLSSTRNLGLAIILAAGWCVLEWIRGWLWTGWGWNGLGVALHDVVPLIQIAAFTGVIGLSFVVAFANVIAIATVRRFILETRTRIRRPHFDFTLTMAGIVGLCAYGLGVMQERPPSTPLRVAAVQSNVPREEKFTRQFQQKTFDTFTHLTELALAAQPPPELILWPESAMPEPVLIDPENNRFVMQLAASMKSDLLLGTIDADESGVYNAAALVSAEGKRVQVYRKLHLVPFGEYLPGRNIIPFLARIVGDQVPADFATGKTPVVFRLTNEKLVAAPLICFEDTLGDLVRQFVLRGANLLANVTNDGWFLRTSASQQHLANAIFRCVETRRPLVRAANTGVTCFVDVYGRVRQTLRDEKGSTFTEGVLTGTIDVPTSGDLTFYTRHGEWFARLCGVVVAIFLVLRLLLFVRRKPAAPASDSRPEGRAPYPARH